MSEVKKEYLEYRLIFYLFESFFKPEIEYQGLKYVSLEFITDLLDQIYQATEKMYYNQSYKANFINELLEANDYELHNFLKENTDISHKKFNDFAANIKSLINTNMSVFKFKLTYNYFKTQLLDKLYLKTLIQTSISFKN